MTVLGEFICANTTFIWFLSCIMHQHMSSYSICSDKHLMANTAFMCDNLHQLWWRMAYCRCHMHVVLNIAIYESVGCHLMFSIAFYKCYMHVVYLLYVSSCGSSSQLIEQFISCTSYIHIVYLLHVLIGEYVD